MGGNYLGKTLFNPAVNWEIIWELYSLIWRRLLICSCWSEPCSSRNLDTGFRNRLVVERRFPTSPLLGSPILALYHPYRCTAPWTGNSLEDNHNLKHQSCVLVDLQVHAWSLTGRIQIKVMSTLPFCFSLISNTSYIVIFFLEHWIQWKSCR